MVVVWFVLWLGVVVVLWQLCDGGVWCSGGVWCGGNVRCGVLEGFTDPNFNAEFLIARS